MKLDATHNPATQIATKPKKSCTTLLCELTRLKSQQKYLECNQVKLNADNFLDEEHLENATATTNSNCNAKTVSMINEIENLKCQFESNLQAHRASALFEVKDVWLSVNKIREDVMQPERLKQFSLQSIRERIISINSQLERLNSKNRDELAGLQIECVRLENESKDLIK